jgi:hypothetical protein
MLIRRGSEEKILYSLSRWTDLPAAKWGWFLASLRAGEMIAFDQRDAMPYRWSLAPEDTYGLVFWTKNPKNLVQDRAVLDAYPLHIHMTLTGWVEEERGAPALEEGCALLREVVSVYGAERVTWRMSPLPVLPEGILLSRFDRILDTAGGAGLKRVVVAFVQTNDLVQEPRGEEEKLALLHAMADRARPFGVDVELCADDRRLTQDRKESPRLGVCVPPIFGPTPVERCGCALMADPFTINESCNMGCSFCYAADRSLSPHKRNTTKGTLQVLR